MKKVLSLSVALVMFLSVFSALPIVTSAAQATLKASASYTYGSSSGNAVTMHGYKTRPYALSWSNTSDGYRTGYIAFPFGDVDLTGQKVSRAALNLTVSKTQNMNESNSAINIYAVDFDEIDNSGAKPTAPTSDILLATFTPPSAVQSQGDYTYPVSIDVDLTEYLETYPNSKGVGILLTNRDDLFSLRGMIGFYGCDEGDYAPTLTLAYGSEASVIVKMTSSDGKYSDSKEFTNLYSGDSFEVTDLVAPFVIDTGSAYYMRDALEAVVLTAGLNTVTVEYRPITVKSADTDFDIPPMISGGTPALPKSLSVTLADGGGAVVPVAWEKVTDAKYTADLHGVSVTKEVRVLPCDSTLTSFNSSGDSSDGASFSTYNDLQLSVAGGSVIFDTEFTVESGTNKLICYGDGTTSSFSGCGALLRMFSARAGEGYVFEYHNGGWMQSDVVCEYGVSYILRTEIDVTNKAYSLYISADGGSFEAVCENAAFRNSSLVTVDRMFFSGTMTVKKHLGHWLDGYSLLTIESVSADGIQLREPYVIKCGTGVLYTYDTALTAIEKDGRFYIREDVDTYPSKLVTGGSDTLTVVYKSVDPVSFEVPEATVVQGDAANIPPQIKVTFSDGQSLYYSVAWERTDTSAVGDYTVKGSIEGFEREAEAIVHVKGITNLPHTSQNSVAANSGGWNWYVEPSGTHIEPGDKLAARYQSGAYSTGGYEFKHDRTYMGWVEDEGSIVVAQYDHDEDKYTRVVIHKQLESDDHNNPAVVILPDGRIMAVYSMHTNEPYMYFRVSKYPEDITQWNEEWVYYCETRTDTESSTYNATYPTVFMVHDDCGIEGSDVIYVGWRGVHWKPTLAKFSMPDENGRLSVIMGQTQFANTTYGYSTYDGADAPNAKTDGGLTDSGRRPYTKYDYDCERNKIYITFTANHPDNDKRNHIYYLYLDINDQNLYTAKGNLLQPLPKENKAEYKSLGVFGTSGQWGVVTAELVDKYPELLVFDASEQTGQSFNPRNGNAERRGWTWDIKVNEAGEPCIVYVDITATAPGEDGSLPAWYGPSVNDSSRRHHYYWYARWDSGRGEWVKTFLTYAGKWFHENATQERCYSGGLTFDHNAPDANVIYLAIPTMGEYGNIFEIYRWESDDHGATWTMREPLTENSKVTNARPNAVYNYKQNEDGTPAGPRLLWISGEYRYWMNYEYKMGVMTDFSAPGFVARDDPEMFADASLYVGGEKLEALPVGEEITLTAKFNVTNISVGDGEAKFAVAHYSADNILKGVRTVDKTIPARSVPQIGMIGAPKTADGSLSAMGSPEIIVETEYTASFEEGDRLSLFAWNTGVEYPMSSIISIPYEITTSGRGDLMQETFTYEGTKKLILDENEDTFNGWVAKGYNISGAVPFDEDSYVAVTKAPFGNTALHIYRTGGEGLMVSHALPDTDGEDYTIEFTMRCIDEMSWNNTDNSGFTLSHGIPARKDDDTNSASAFQFRHKSEWRDENGRGTSGKVRNTIAFDGGSETEIFHDVPLYRDMSGNTQVNYSKGTGYYDSEAGVYIHDYSDSLMTGSLYRVTLCVHPSLRKVEMSVYDGYRMAKYTTAYNGAASYDWDANPIDTITFSIGSEKWGELYIDNFRVYKTNGQEG